MAQNRIYRDDTAVVFTDIFDENGQAVAATTVSWDFLYPDDSAMIVDIPPVAPITDQVIILKSPQVIDGNPYAELSVLKFDGVNWNQLTPSASSSLTGNEAQLIIPGAAINQIGLYRGRAQFTLPDSTLTSSLTTLEVLDPLPANLGITVKDRIIDHAWMKLEDLFDSEDPDSLGGPWLQDKTFRSFRRDKLARFLPDAIYYINNEYQPVTTFDDTDWPEAHIPLAAQALMLEGIYHLVRSYVEQPLPAGGQISYFDRRDYLNRWQTVLQSEEQKLLHLIDVFKLQYTGFGATAILVGGYATPITRLSKFWRTRYPRYIGPWGF